MQRRAMLVPRDRKAYKAKPGHRAPPVHKGRRVKPAHKVRKGRLVLKVYKDHRAQPAHKARKACKAPLARQARPERRG